MQQRLEASGGSAISRSRKVASKSSASPTYASHSSLSIASGSSSATFSAARSRATAFGVLGVVGHRGAGLDEPAREASHGGAAVDRLALQRVELGEGDATDEGAQAVAVVEDLLDNASRAHDCVGGVARINRCDARLPPQEEPLQRAARPPRRLAVRRHHHRRSSDRATLARPAKR